MLIESKEISFTKAKAPDLMGHVGDTNKEYLFLPDITPAGDDLAVRVEVVKPDGTFVIQDGSITDDGLLITFTTQCYTAAGSVYYIIKLYNTDSVVYSAVGSLYIHKALITDELIESVAEVNGYTFPDDFAFKSEVVRVVANPESEPSEMLNTILIGDVVYSTPASGASFKPLEPDVLTTLENTFIVETEVD